VCDSQPRFGAIFAGSALSSATGHQSCRVSTATCSVVTRCRDSRSGSRSLSVFFVRHRMSQDGVEMSAVTQRDPNTTRMALRSVTMAGLLCPGYASGVPNHTTENENST
jgi:hypothetical protein